MCPRLPALLGATPRPRQRLALRACLVLGDGQREQRAAGVLTVFLTTNRFDDEPQYANSVTIQLTSPPRTPQS